MKYNRLRIIKSGCFRRWENKNYSVFRSLGKVIKICTLLLCYFSNGILSAQESLDTVKLEDIVISSNRASSIYSETARIVSLITQAQIKSAPVTNLQDLLKSALSLDIRQRGAEGVQADISIRGGGFEQTLILLNGIKINDPQSGHHNLNLPISLTDIDHIEILEGPGARVYGPNAFSGAINIITKTPDKNNLNVDVSAGQYKYLSGGISGSIIHKNFNNYISATHKRSDGYIDNTDFSINNAYYKGSVKLKSADIQVHTGFLSKNYGANSFYTPKYPNQYEQTKTIFADLKSTFGKKVRFSPVVYWRRHYDKFELFRDNPPSWYKTHNYHRTDIFGFDFNSTIFTRFGKTAIGAELREEKIISNILGTILDNPIPVANENGINYTKGKTRHNASIFIEHNFQLKRFSTSAGTLINQNSDYNWHNYAGIDISYQITRQIKAFGSINHSLRMPTFTDLYYSSPTNIGNPNLKPENSMTYESGFKYFSGSITANLAIFNKISQNSIDWVRKPDSIKWVTENLTDINTTGIEASVSIFFNNFLGDYFPITSLNANYTYLTSTKSSGDYISYYVMDYLKNKFCLSLNHRIYKNFGAGWQLIYQERAGTYSHFNKTLNSFDSELPYKPFSLVDCKLYHTSKRIDIWVKFSNLFNTKYFDPGNIEMPGRWIIVGVNLKLQY